MFTLSQGICHCCCQEISWHLLGHGDSLRRKNSMWQQPGAMGGEKILLHIRQEAKLRFHSLLRHGLSNDLHLCMMYGMQTCTGHDGGAGEGQGWCVALGRLWEAVLVRARPAGLGSVLHQVCWSWTKPGCLTCFPAANNSMKPVPDMALPGQLRKLWEAGREEEHQ